MRKTFEEISAQWEEARLSSTSREEFQEKWSRILEAGGWTREEFHLELDRAHFRDAGSSIS